MIGMTASTKPEEIYHAMLSSIAFGTRRMIEIYRENGVKINVWTVDDPADAEELIGWGVDYVTSNILE